MHHFVKKYQLFLSGTLVIIVGVIFIYFNKITPNQAPSAPVVVSVEALVSGENTELIKKEDGFGQVSTTSTTTLIAPAPITKKKPQVSHGSNFGMSVGATLYWLNESELNAELDDMVSLGVGWIRVDFSWNMIQQKNSTNYDWSRVDRVVKAANARNIKVLPILGYTPKWARNPACVETEKCAPVSEVQFAVFSKVAAQRYSKQGIHVWEIWNEPNLKGFWKPEADVVTYVNFLKASSVAIKEVDPLAVVVTGGLGPAATRSGDVAPIDFLTQVYALGGKDYFDAVGFHPYSYPATPLMVLDWSGWSQMNDISPSLRSVMAANGDESKKIWMTEIGAPTGGPKALATSDDLNLDDSPDHVSEELQVKIFQNAMTLHKGFGWAGPIFWYSYKDLGVTKDTNENFFGVLRYNGTKKPVYEEIKNFNF